MNKEIGENTDKAETTINRDKGDTLRLRQQQDRGKVAAAIQKNRGQNKVCDQS